MARTDLGQDECWLTTGFATEAILSLPSGSFQAAGAYCRSGLVRLHMRRRPSLNSQAADWAARARPRRAAQAWDMANRFWRRQPSTLAPTKGGGDAGRSG